MAFSPTTIVMTTYSPPDKLERSNYARHCIRALSKKLVGGTLRFHIADDGSPQKEYDSLVACANYYFGRHNVTHSQTQRRGIGGSLNQALRQINTDWMYTTDDWLITSAVDLRPVRVLIDQFGYDIVRLGPIHPNLACWTRFNTLAGWYLELDQTKGGFAFATRPFIATKNFYNTVGPFKENVDAYVTERDYSDRVAVSQVKLAAINLLGPWQHIGEVEVGTIDPNAK